MEFDHLGLTTTEKKKDEDYVEQTKVWVTNPKNHPFKIEWLRYESDSPVKGPVKDKPHIAYKIKNLKEASRGLKILLEPFDVGFATVGFYETEDGAVIELMEYKGDTPWFKR